MIGRIAFDLNVAMTTFGVTAAAAAVSKSDIKESDREAKSSNDQVAGFAKDTLPTLHKHLEAAQSLVKAETAAK